MVEDIKKSKSDKELKDVLYEVYITTQYDSHIRAEFDNYYMSKNKII